MNNNKVSNPKTEVPQTNKMNDKDYITAMLSIEKSMLKNYAVSLTEASNDDLYNDYIKIYGLCRWISNGSEHGPYERNIKLRDLILTNNCIIETAPSEYYYLFSEIEYIKDSNGNLIWGKI